MERLNLAMEGLAAAAVGPPHGGAWFAGAVVGALCTTHGAIQIIVAHSGYFHPAECHGRRVLGKHDLNLEFGSVETERE
ncbi:MAG: hypothetical protein K9M97_04530 [Akkermansiaceae bacterium]|nr:hypothetical protein [Akkermansiaceae bacterium]